MEQLASDVMEFQIQENNTTDVENVEVMDLVATIDVIWMDVILVCCMEKDVSSVIMEMILSALIVDLTGLNVEEVMYFLKILVQVIGKTYLQLQKDLEELPLLVL